MIGFAPMGLNIAGNKGAVKKHRNSLDHCEVCKDHHNRIRPVKRRNKYDGPKQCVGSSE